MNTRSLIRVHHIGGRDGSCPFPIHNRFKNDLHITYYDADADCLDQIEARTRGIKSRVLPHCLYSCAGVGTLRINYDPYTSSLLPFNPEYADYNDVLHNYVHNRIWRYFKYDFGECMKCVESREVKTVTLDSLNQQVDFLCLDTQGSEFQILLGAGNTLEGVLGAQMEVEFHELYEGQKLFGDILQHMSRNGFLFIGFAGKSGKLAPNQTPVTCRGNGVQLFDDAIFIRKPNTVQLRDVQDHIQLFKLAFIALMYGQIELAYSSLLMADRNAESVKSNILKTEYGRLLNELENAFATQPQWRLRTFSEMYTQHESRNRFVNKPSKGGGLMNTLSEWYNCSPQSLQWLAESAWGLMTLVRKAKLLKTRFWRHPAFQRNTPVERIFGKYRLDDLRKIIKRNRLKYAVDAYEAPASANRFATSRNLPDFTQPHSMGYPILNATPN